jgi:hypothetical protein
MLKMRDAFRSKYLCKNTQNEQKLVLICESDSKTACHSGFINLVITGTWKIATK